MDINKHHELEQRHCPICNISQEEVIAHHVTGCPYCYVFFNLDIKNALMQHSNVLSFNIDAIHEENTGEAILLLKKALHKSIEQEAYEQAAVYRDQLKALGVFDEL